MSSNSLDPLQPSPTNPSDFTARVAKLMDVATREYASSKGSFLLVAFPSGVNLGRCKEDDPAAGLISNGQIALPWGCICTTGCAEVKDRAFNLLAFSRFGCKPDEMNRFVSFAAEAGALMVASPPTWAPVNSKPGLPVANWIGALMFVEHVAPEFVTEIPGGCRLVAEPWAMSLTALRKWQSLSGQETGQTDKKADKKRKKSRPIPANSDIVRLAKLIRKKRRLGISKIEIAREFCENDEGKAQSLLRQLRRYPHLTD